MPRSDETSPAPIPRMAMLEEMPLPDPDKLAPEQLLTALSRDPAPQYQNAVVMMTRQYTCPCGCGTEKEELLMFSAGSDMSPMRELWMIEKAKMNLMGIDTEE